MTVVGDEQQVKGVPQYVVKPLTPDQQAYLKTLNVELLYAQKAYNGFLQFLRKAHNAPESDYLMTNIEQGFVAVYGLPMAPGSILGGLTHEQ